MKKVLCFLFFIANISAQGQTSVYHPFPDSNAVWNFGYMASWGCGPPLYLFLYENYSLVMTGDTTINSQQHHKLYIPFVQSNCPGGPMSHASGYVGCIRQDTAMRKVYFVYPNSAVDSLLYDFNMQVGDTVKGLTESFAFPSDTVISIDSVLVGNDYRKRWLINTCYGIYLIEGIGSTYGLKEVSPGCLTDANEYSLLCFKQNGIPLYPDTTASCNLIDDIISIADENTFSIFPNPSTSELIIRGLEFGEIRELTIYNVLGKKVIIQQQTTNDKQQTVDVSQLLPGVYFVAVTDDKGNKITRRFIKM